VFRRGSGHDRVGDTGSSGDADLVLLEGLGASDVELGWTYNNGLRIRVTSSGDELVFDKHFDPVSRNKLEAIQFADGTTYDAAAIESLARQNKDEFLFGTSGADLIDAGGGDDDVHGGAGDDRLLGGTGNDSLDGESGADIMDGGQGNDSFVVDNAGDVVSEAAVGGVDRVAASVSFVLPENVESLTLVGTSAINGTGNALDNVLTGNSAANRLDGGAGNDVLNGGAGADTLAGGAGDDTYYVDNTSDTVTENANEGTDLVIASVTRTLGVNQENLTLSGTSAINGTGNPLNNLLKGNAANNTLNGAAGTDVLQGAAGSDTVTDTSGRGIHDGGDGADTLIGGTDRQFFAGGTGDDVLTLGGGADVIGFNRGHGADVINAPTNGTGLGEKNDTVSLSGVTYRDLRLARDASDLVLKVAGTADSVRLKGWYGSSNNQTINQLQLIVDSTADYNAASSDPLRNKRVIQVNFGRIVAAFDAAGSPSDWAVPEATLAAALVAGSDVDAIGGQLAYRYAKDGNFAGVDLATAVSVLNDAGFATAAQSIGMGATSGGVRLAKSLASTTSAPALDPQAALVGPSATLADDWVTAQPVQRVVAPDAPEPTVSAGGGFAPYLTQADVARALYGIDSAAGERTTIETYDYAFPVEQVAGDLFAFNEQRHLAIARQWEVAEAGSRGFAGDIGFSSAIGDERQPVVPAYWMLAADVNPGEIGRRGAVAR
jgi:Ca2+-binding RTX toxin-like protein